MIDTYNEKDKFSFENNNFVSRRIRFEIHKQSIFGKNREVENIKKLQNSKKCIF